MIDRRYQVVRTGTPLENSEPEAALLATAGADLIAGPPTDSAEADLIAALRDADIVINSGNRLTKGVIDGLSRCQAIIQQSVGFDVIDVAAATERGILVANLFD